MKIIFLKIFWHLNISLKILSADTFWLLLCAFIGKTWQINLLFFVWVEILIWRYTNLLDEWIELGLSQWISVIHAHLIFATVSR